MFESSSPADFPKRPEDEVTDDEGQSDQTTNGSTHSAASISSDEQRIGTENLGGEAAPDITPEQFQRLMEEGSIRVDGRGRVRTSRTGSTREGMSLRKRRAWYLG